MKNKTYLLYGKNTLILVIVEMLATLAILTLGVIWSSQGNFIALIMMVACASFFFVDSIKKIKYRLIINDEGITVNNDELPLTKRIQYYNTISYDEIESIYIEEDKLNSKNENIKEFPFPKEKMLKYLTFKCTTKNKRICIMYLKDEEIEDIIDLIIYNMEANNNSSIALSGSDILEKYKN